LISHFTFLLPAALADGATDKKLVLRCEHQPGLGNFLHALRSKCNQGSPRVV
jgi:hypothetical protein